MALSETDDVLDDINVVSNDESEEVLFSVAFEFANVEVEEVCDGGNSAVEGTDDKVAVTLLLDELLPTVGLLFLSTAGDCSSSVLELTVDAVGLGGTAVAVGLSRPLLRRCSTT